MPTRYHWENIATAVETVAGRDHPNQGFDCSQSTKTKAGAQVRRLFLVFFSVIPAEAGIQ